MLLRSLLLLLSVGTVLPPAPSSAAEPLAVFPGAAGHGKHSFAGSGRHLNPPQTAIYRVTTLADTGEGSLRAAVAAAEPRVVVFEISGVIDCKRPLVIRSPYITIAGQTAPSPGITLIGSGVTIRTHDVLLQHLAIRAGDKPSPPYPPGKARDALSLSGLDPVYNVVVDHCSISWGLDETLAIGSMAHSVDRVTISNCIISESLLDSIHEEGPHSMGVIVDGRLPSGKISFLRNLLAHNRERNIRITGGGQIEMIDNLIYNWGDGPGNLINIKKDGNKDTGPLMLDVIGNVYLPGPDSGTKAKSVVRSSGSIDPGTRIYVDATVGPGRPQDAGDAWLVVDRDIPARPHRAIKPVAASDGYKRLEGPEQVRLTVTAGAGARPGDRDPIDRRIARDVERGSGAIINRVADDGTPKGRKNAGGWPEREENRRALELPENPHGDSDRDGYTNLEEYLFEFARKVETTS